MMFHTFSLFALTLFFQSPFHCKEQDFRIKKEPIEIKIDRTSPAFMALLETLPNPRKENTDDPISPQVVVTLRAGEISSSDQEVIRKSDQIVTLPPIRISTRDFIEDVEEFDLTPRMERRLRGAEIDTAELKELLKSAPTLQERTQELVKEELQNVALYQRDHPNVSPVPEVAKINQNLVSVGSAPLRVPSAGVHPTKEVSYRPSQERVVRKGFPSGQEPAPLTPSFMESSQKNPRGSPENHKIVVHGPLEISDGLAFIGDRQRFKLHRLQANTDMFMEEGFVNVEKGTYEISLKNPQGVLVAEVLSREGEVLGRGEVALDQNLQTSFDNGLENIEGPKIIIKPTSFGISGRVISEADSYDQFIWPIPKAIVSCREQSLQMKANSEGYFEELAYLGGSSLILEGKSDKFWPTVQLGLSGDANPILLFTEERVQALLNWDRPQVVGREFTYPAIIWGKVVDEKGQPVEGARIVVASETPVWPTYFKWHLPGGSTLSETSVDGEFAIVGLRDEAVSLKAIKGQMVSTIEVVPTRENAITPVRLVFSETRQIPVEMFDGMEKTKRVSAAIKEIGADQEILVDAHEEVNFYSFSEKRGLIFLETESDEYIESRHIMPTSTPVVRLPMVKREWLTNLLQNRKISIEPGTGLIAGFFQGEIESIQLEEGINYDYRNLLFFDSRGEIVNELKQAIGGGYILFNVPVGFRTLSIYPEGSSRFFSQIFIVDSVYLSIVDHLF